MNLRNVDLNILVVLDVLLEERNVSKAGERIGLSQSATSAVLSRLRYQFDDPLLVRVGRRLILTKKAELLQAPLREALAAIESTLLHGDKFAPAHDARTFSISASDYAVLVLLTPLVQALSKEAPRVTIHLLPRTSNVGGMLSAGEADIVIEPAALFSEAGFPHRTLFRDRWVCAVDGSGPFARKGAITKSEFSGSPHLVYGIGLDRKFNLGDLHLKEIGVERQIEVTVESFLLAPKLLENTSLVSLVLERAARQMSSLADVTLLDPPYDVPDIVENMYWHSRNENDPAHVWLRQRIADIAATLPG